MVAIWHKWSRSRQQNLPVSLGSTRGLNPSARHATHGVQLTRSPPSNSVDERNACNCKKRCHTQAPGTPRLGVHTWLPPISSSLVLTGLLALRVSASFFLQQWSEDAKMYQGYNQLRNSDRKKAGWVPVVNFYGRP